MTWAYTAQVAIYAAIVGGAAWGYARWIAWDFERKWGKEKRPTPEL